MKKFKTTLQTMMIHQDIDALGAYEALRKVKAIGYNAVEISGHFECNQELVDGFCRARDDFGMEIGALSVNYTGNAPSDMPALFRHKPLLLTEDFDRVVDYCKQLGTHCVRYAGMPVTQLDTREKLDDYLNITQEYALRLKEHGILMCAHNHATEFAKLDGKTYFDWEVDACPDLCFEFDVLGAAYAAMDLCDCLERIKGRVPLIHIEDIKIATKPMFEGGRRTPLEEIILGCPLGEGNVNILKFCDKAIACGNEYFIIEVSDFHGMDPYEGMKLAADNLKAAGYADTF